MARPRSRTQAETSFDAVRSLGTVFSKQINTGTIAAKRMDAGTYRAQRYPITVSTPFNASLKAGTREAFVMPMEYLSAGVPVRIVDFQAGIGATAATTGTIFCRLRAPLNTAGRRMGTFAQNITSNILWGTDLNSGGQNQGAFTAGTYGTLSIEYWYRPGAAAHGVGTNLFFKVEVLRDYT